MKIQFKNTERKRKILAIIGLSACALCCLLPIIGAGVGLTGIISFFGKIEKIAILLLSLAMVLYGIDFIRKYKNRRSCSTDCSCRPENQK
ncbi:hypothetical protein [Paraflavitalea sp. CAU 1676]|uniref:hypothetical protein n=1 Tax=Paraflavitalea sp. CAU 1676 TaxID=3032598 RepID=UPI0023DB878B|nr:hypothetical protein [Paraflavitalea sp. CAU 1676]MDF2191314.1 hypothetical protein [Paraflavitalea sp. CAU 1676]